MPEAVHRYVTRCIRGGDLRTTAAILRDVVSAHDADRLAAVYADHGV